MLLAVGIQLKKTKKIRDIHGVASFQAENLFAPVEFFHSNLHYNNQHIIQRIIKQLFKREYPFPGKFKIPIS